MILWGEFKILKAAYDECTMCHPPSEKQIGGLGATYQDSSGVLFPKEWLYPKRSRGASFFHALKVLFDSVGRRKKGKPNLNQGFRWRP